MRLGPGRGFGRIRRDSGQSRRGDPCGRGQPRSGGVARPGHGLAGEEGQHGVGADPGDAAAAATRVSPLRTERRGSRRRDVAVGEHPLRMAAHVGSEVGDLGRARAAHREAEEARRGLAAPDERSPFHPAEQHRGVTGDLRGQGVRISILVRVS